MNTTTTSNDYSDFNFTGCKYLQSEDGIPDFKASTLTFIFGVLQVLTSFLIVLYLYCHSNFANRNTTDSTLDALTSSRREFVESTTSHRNEQLVLPVYHLCLWGVAMADLLQGVFNVIFPISPGGGNPFFPTSILFGLSYGVYHFVLEGIAFLLAQQGVGRYSLRRSLTLAFFWGIVTFGIQVIAFRMQPKSILHYSATLCWEAIMFFFYFILAFWPVKWLPGRCCTRRPALRKIYAPFWAVLRFLSCTSIVLQMYSIDFGICLYDLGVLMPFAILKPFVIYFALRSDSRFWMGLGSQSHPLQQPLRGSTLLGNSARALATHIDISTTRGVKMLQPSLLQLDGSSRMDILGIGGSARVMRARYQGRVVAAKLLFLPELTPAHVQSLCNEASLLSGVTSEHVLKILGLVVRPPSIFLISEVATYGSLFDICHSDTTLSKNPLADLTSSGIKKFNKNQKTLLFRLNLAIGCCESVQVLHQQNPIVVHGDIKGQNFLLNDDHMVKIADLELASRCYSMDSSLHSPTNSPSNSPSNSFTRSSSIPQLNDDEEKKISSSSSPQRLEQLRRLSQSVNASDPDYRISETYNWLAPEVINGFQATPSSDIYSLAMTLFEVFTDTVPYSNLLKSARFHADELKHSICIQNIRPGSSGIEEIDDLLHKMWNKNYKTRPSISIVLKELRTIICHLLFGELNFFKTTENDLIYIALEQSNLTAAVLDASPPFRVKYVTKKWEKECGWKSSQIQNKTIMQCMRGPRTNSTRSRNLKQALALGDFFVSSCVHYRSDGKPMLHIFSTTPLKGTHPKVLLRSATMML